MADYQVNAGINSLAVLAGSVLADAQFATQPIAGDQIVYPNNIAVDSQLNITGPTGTHKLWHIQQNGDLQPNDYVIASGGVGVTTADYEAGPTFTTATLQAGFDPYIFQDWVTQPVAGEQLITLTADGYFDSQGNYYSEIEGIHSAWHVALDGTMTHFEIDNRLTVTSSDITPNAFSFVDLVDQARSTLIESAPIDVLGMDAGLDSPVTVTGGEWSKSSDNGDTWTPFTSAAGTVQNNDKVKVRHTTDAAGLVATSTTLDINGVSDVFTTITAADLTPDPFILGNRANVDLLTVVESDPVQVSGMTEGQDSPVTISGGEYAISVDDVSYSDFTSEPGSIQNGQFIKVRHTSSSTEADNRVTVLTIETVSGSFVSTTVTDFPDLLVNDPTVVVNKFFGDSYRARVFNAYDNWVQFEIFNAGSKMNLGNATNFEIKATNSLGQSVSVKQTDNPSIFSVKASEGLLDVMVGQLGLENGSYYVDVIYYDALHNDGAVLTGNRPIIVELV